MLKIKEKEAHNSQTKLNNLEDTLAKNKLEKTTLDREVSNLKNSVKILEKKSRKEDNNNERSVLAKIQDSRNVQEALKTNAKYNSSSADTNETEDENLKNLYNIPTTKNRNITSRTNTLNPTIRINPDLKHDSTSFERDIAKRSNTAEEDSEARVEENFDVDEEQAILDQISRIIK